MKKRYFFLAVFFIGCLMMLTSCENDPEDVKLKEEKALKAYAEENCHACTFERFDKSKERNTAVFTDDKCGFEFEVISKPVSVSFDGCVVGYKEDTSDNWEACYVDYLYDKVADETESLAAEGKFEFIKEDNKRSVGKVLWYIRGDLDLEGFAPYLRKIGAAVRKADVYGLCAETELWAYSSPDRKETFKMKDMTAFYRLKDDAVIAFDDYDGYIFTDKAEKELGVKCTYVRSDKMALGDIPGVEDKVNLEKIGRTKKVAVYYFRTADGKQKLIADFQPVYGHCYITDVDE